MRPFNRPSKKTLLVAAVASLLLVAGLGSYHEHHRLPGAVLPGKPPKADSWVVHNEMAQPLDAMSEDMKEAACKSIHERRCGAPNTQYYCIKDVTGKVIGCSCLSHDALLGASWCEYARATLNDNKTKR